MESKLLVGGKNIVDHTNEQQKILEQKRQEIAEQVTFHSLLRRRAWDKAHQCYRVNISFIRFFRKNENGVFSPFPVGDSDLEPQPCTLV